MRKNNGTVSSQILISLRRATIEDAKKVYAWRNDPDIRAVSGTTKALTMKTHMKWFGERLQLTFPEAIWIVINDEAEPIGYGRIALRGVREAKISIVIDKSFRGRGLGRQVIKLLKQKIQAMGRTALAEVHVKNLTSLRAFMANGFSGSYAFTHGSIVMLRAEPN